MTLVEFENPAVTVIELGVEDTAKSALESTVNVSRAELLEILFPFMKVPVMMTLYVPMIEFVAA